MAKFGESMGRGYYDGRDGLGVGWNFLPCWLYQRMLRRLRIAVSVSFALVAVALCVLWVRSYSNGFVVGGVFRNEYRSVSLENGRFGFISAVSTARSSGNNVFFAGGWNEIEWVKIVGCECNIFGNGWNFSMPLAFPLFGVAMLGAIPWIPFRFRFSLHTLLIGMTLVAVVLGLGLWAAS